MKEKEKEREKRKDANVAATWIVSPRADYLTRQARLRVE